MCHLNSPCPGLHRWDHSSLALVFASLWLPFTHRPSHFNSTAIKLLEHHLVVGERRRRPPPRWLTTLRILRPSLRKHRNLGEQLMLPVSLNWTLMCCRKGYGLAGPLCSPLSRVPRIQGQNGSYFLGNLFSYSRVWCSSARYCRRGSLVAGLLTGARCSTEIQTRLRFCENKERERLKHTCQWDISTVLGIPFWTFKMLKASV